MPDTPSWLSFYRDPLRGWFLFFFLIQLSFPMPMSTNPLSRWAMLSAMTEEGTPRIDAYRTATIDWAQTPDGHYYSNKAPGPALLGEPVFAVLDAWQTRGEPDRDNRDRVRHAKGGGNLRVLSFLFQILPFFVFGLLLLGQLEKAGASRGARSAALIALLFGNTASIFLNQYFGHGLASVCALGLYYAVLTRRLWLSAFCFGLGVLCEYSSALLLLPLIPFWVGSWRRSENSRIWLAEFLGGAILPLSAWVAYHTYCFGSPFRIPNQFQNPLFVERAADRWNIGGLFFLPSGEALWGLTLGWSRGLLFTQPWVLFLIVVLVGMPSVRRTLFTSQWRELGLPLIFFALLFGMNSAFGGWHGGGTAGPRYLSAGLVLMAPALGFVWDRLSLQLQRLAWVLVGLSVCLQILFLSVYLGLPEPGVPLWAFYWEQLTGPHGGTPVLRLAVAFPIALVLFYRILSSKSNLAPAADH